PGTSSAARSAMSAASSPAQHASPSNGPLPGGWRSTDDRGSDVRHWTYRHEEGDGRPRRGRRTRGLSGTDHSGFAVLFKEPFYVLLVALTADLAFGEPSNSWHPVAWLGWVIGQAQGRLMLGSRWRLRVAGAVLVVAVAGGAAVVAWGVS